MTDYTWKVDQIHTLQQPNENYVVQVKWTLTGTKNGIVRVISDQAKIIADESTTFVPYANLTEEIIVEWVKAALGEQRIEDYKAALEKKISSALDLAQVPKSTSLPWASV